MTFHPELPKVRVNHPDTDITEACDDEDIRPYDLDVVVHAARAKRTLASQQMCALVLGLDSTLSTADKIALYETAQNHDARSS